MDAKEAALLRGFAIAAVIGLGVPGFIFAPQLWNAHTVIDMIVTAILWMLLSAVLGGLAFVFLMMARESATGESFAVYREGTSRDTSSDGGEGESEMWSGGDRVIESTDGGSDGGGSDGGGDGGGGSSSN
jgi:hypothetical protein